MLYERRPRPGMVTARNLPPPMFEKWSWQLQGNCRQQPLELFFPDERGHRLLKKEARAKSICRSCPVVVACRDYALQAQEAHGIWGALTPRERAELLSARSRLPVATELQHSEGH